MVAHVTPLLDGSRPVDYLSVRSLHSLAQIDQTEVLYAARQIMELIDDSTRRVEASEALTRDARASIDATLAQVCAFTTPISNIDPGARAQLSDLGNAEQLPRARRIAGTYSASPLAHVHDAIRQLESISHQNARLVEQLPRSASQMLHDTEQVSAALHIFRLAASETRALPDAVALRRAAKLA